MKKSKKILCLLCAVLSLAAPLTGCIGQEESGITEPQTYEYDVKNAFYPRPSFSNEGTRLDALTTATEDGTFYCFTQDQTQADAFLHAQTELLSFLKAHGVELRKLHFYGVDYEDNFSEHSKNTAHIAFSSMGSWQQVLVTLQTLWGDNVEYGYLYALSNAVAAELGWTTDPVADTKQSDMDAFFAANPDAIGLLYPTFTTDFASQETVDCCKAMSLRLFEEADLNEALASDIETQLEQHHERLRSYAASISVPYAPQTIGYSYYGEFLPLRIQTTYAEMIVDADFKDNTSGESGDWYGDYWGDYASIYETASVIDREIQDTVAYFGLEDEAGMVQMHWLSSESALQRFGKPMANYYISPYQEVVVTMMQAYAHEYHHHIQHIFSPDTDLVWQSQAFCEIGRSKSYYGRLPWDAAFVQLDHFASLFHDFTGRAYEPGTDDYFEAYDILCYCFEDYELDYLNGRNPINSFSRYLMDRYGEGETMDLMLYPDTVESVTGKSWDTLQLEWEQSIREKYAGIPVPDWMLEENQ